VWKDLKILFWVVYYGSVLDDQIFDTTDVEVAKQINSKVKDIRPYVLSVGHGMLLKGLDDDLIGKEIGKEHSVEISPENAFGKRDPQAVKMIPMQAFREHKIIPERGMQFEMDGRLVRVAAVSGGRVLVDFNHPMAGKKVRYEYKILREIKDEKEKVDALQEFFFKEKFEFDLNKEKKELTLKIPASKKGMDQYIEKILAKPFEEILGVKVKCEMIEEKKK
jgi:FKBP-type peptidyl-prolyl cis-trans isomerase 2